MKPEVISRQILCRPEYKGRAYLQLVKILYKNKRGEEAVYFSTERVGSKRAISIVATVEDKLVVTREFRPALDGYEWGLPAGLIDNDESAYDTAKRELKEETGLDAISFTRKASPFVVSSAGMSNESSSIVYIKAMGAISDKHLEESEDIQAYLFSREDVQNLLNRAQLENFEDFIGAKSWLVFEQFVRDGFKNASRSERMIRRQKRASLLERASINPNFVDFDLDLRIVGEANASWHIDSDEGDGYTFTEGKGRKADTKEYNEWIQQLSHVIDWLRSHIDYSPYFESIPEHNIYFMRLPKEMNPPNERSIVDIEGNKYRVLYVTTAEEIGKRRGGPVMNSMLDAGLWWDVKLEKI